MSSSSSVSMSDLTGSVGSIRFTENFGPPEIRSEEIKYIEKIGGGCFGAVYRGTCRGKEVAVKKLFRQDLTEKALNDFKKEVEICAKIPHPNVCLFMGACLEPGHMAIVTEMMPKGNLEKLLHDPNRQISFYRRLMYARDTAQGMNWLHCSSPQIIHRDLKPSNLLVGQDDKVKVCDFGLSCVKPIGEKLQDTDSIPGTPLWMAPEVMMGKPLDEKTDIYSYGIVLWEIVTQQVPFVGFDSFPRFKNAICYNDVRPNCEDIRLPSLRNLLQLCWHKNPAMRPSFGEIITTLDGVIIEACLEDQLAQDLWKNSFLGKEYVNWNIFFPHLCDNLGIPVPGPDDIQHKCLRALLAKKSPDATLRAEARPDVVFLDRFGQILEMFGPLKRPPGHRSFLEDIEQTLRCKWFHGDISRERSEELLKIRQPGHYLIRSSTTVPGQPFTISKVSRNKTVNHQRINHLPGGSYSIKINKNDQHLNLESPPGSNLVDFINLVSREINLNHEVAGNKYEHLFQAVNTSGIDGYQLEHME